jgi:CO/xanthine dehydrogenase FAD-binding subunit
MNTSQYEAPGSVDEAVALLANAKGNARVLAGGTDLLVQIRMGMADPALIVDIKKIAEMTTITAENGGFRIGGAVSSAELKKFCSKIYVAGRRRSHGSHWLHANSRPVYASG